MLKRDGYKCADCGIGREEHYSIYGLDLNVHHIDGKGWGTQKEMKNNSLDNLITLCHSCHRNRHR